MPHSRNAPIPKLPPPIPSYPLELDLSGRAVLVVGGGTTAARHAQRLAAAGADVLVVATRLCEDLADLVESARARWLRRELSPADLSGAWLVHAATDSAVDDTRVLALCDFARVWCVADGNPDAPARRPAPALPVSQPPA
jgi:uroporphyrin-III C-methyltransferase/precorrin-2 dehydrogenase/sirohydrochlorin ferrochelatase